jgi:copper chaperone CopZ
MRTAQRIKWLAVVMMSIFIVSAAAFGQESEADTAKVKFETSAYSFMCKNRIESEVSSIDGVEECYLDMDSKELRVEYDKEKTTEEEIKKVVIDMGYECKKIDKDKKS